MGVYVVIAKGEWCHACWHEPFRARLGLTIASPPSATRRDTYTSRVETLPARKKSKEAVVPATPCVCDFLRLGGYFVKAPVEPCFFLRSLCLCLSLHIYWCSWPSLPPPLVWVFHESTPGTQSLALSGVWLLTGPQWIQVECTSQWAKAPFLGA